MHFQKYNCSFVKEIGLIECIKQKKVLKSFKLNLEVCRSRGPLPSHISIDSLFSERKHKETRCPLHYFLKKCE